MANNVIELPEGSIHPTPLHEAHLSLQNQWHYRLFIRIAPIVQSKFTGLLLRQVDYGDEIGITEAQTQT
jgi:hypothetical protein